MSLEKDQPEVDAWLHQHGIPHGIKQLRASESLCPDSVAKLLELLKSPFSLETRAVIAEALFAREPALKEKHEATGVLLAILKENAGQADQKLSLRLAKLVASSTLMNGELVWNSDPSQVHDIGEMFLDSRHGKLRGEFSFALRQIGNEDAITYLERGTKDPQVAAFALRALVVLRPGERTLALCQEALKLPGVADTDAVQTFTGMQYQLVFKKETAKADAWLAARGIQTGIVELRDNHAPCPESVPQLLEMFKLPWSIGIYVLISRALFARKPNATQKREAIEVILGIVRENMGNDRPSIIETLVLNDLADNVDAGRVHELGKMMLDERYGDLCACFTRAMQKIGNAEAVGYLKQAVKIPSVASLALYALAQLRVEGTLELCEEALNNPKIQYKDAVKETYSKLKRRLAKKPATVSHATKKPVPKELEEWSTNLDGRDLSKVLRGIQKCIEAGFGKPEIAEVRSAADELSAEVEEASGNDTARFEFKVKSLGQDAALWLEVFCDDVDAFDLYVFGEKELIGKIDGELSKILKD